MQDINLLSHCFIVQWKYNLRSKPISTGSGRRKRSTKSHPGGKFNNSRSLDNDSAVSAEAGAYLMEVQYSREGWLGHLLLSHPLSYHNPGISPVPSKDQSMSHTTVSDTRS